MKYLTRIFLCFLVISCEKANTNSNIDIEDVSLNNQEFIEYYPNGNIKLKAEYKDSLLNGKYEKYFNDGLPEIMTNYSKGKLLGKYVEYYQSGNLKKNFNFLDHSIQGAQFEYYDTKNSQIKSKKVVLKISNSLIEMMNKQYDLNYQLMYDSSKIVISSDFDTLNFNQIKDIQLSFIDPEYKIFRLHIGNYDGNFKLIDSTDYRMEESKKPIFTINIPTAKKGSQYIRGYIEEYYIEKVEKNITTTIGNIGSYFEYDYFVK